MKNLISLKKSFKLALASVALLGMQAIPTHVFAADPAFDQGSNTIGLGIGFGLGYSYYSGATTAPALAFIYDHGFFPEVGPGTIGIGGIIGYKTAKYDYPYSGGYSAKWTNTIVAVRGTYHLTILAEKNNKFDPYAGVVLGLRFNSYKDTYDDYFYNTYGYHYGTYSSTSIVSGAFIGAKYNFADAVGAFAELGYDICYAKIGINFNF
ncbi:MAG TPA: hypothetical protein PKK99_03680 [Bacteroidia bacterium]|nr:hypothetical protein [Bacteroidia bacterium]HNP98126.1 hypothetical protein [Bacteroidia bacterium]